MSWWRNMRLAGRQTESEGLLETYGSHMNYCVESTSALADGDYPGLWSAGRRRKPPLPRRTKHRGSVINLYSQTYFQILAIPRAPREALSYSMGVPNCFHSFLGTRAQLISRSYPSSSSLTRFLKDARRRSSISYRSLTSIVSSRSGKSKRSSPSGPSRKLNRRPFLSCL